MSFSSWLPLAWLEPGPSGLLLMLLLHSVSWLNHVPGGHVAVPLYAFIWTDTCLSPDLIDCNWWSTADLGAYFFLNSGFAWIFS